MAVKKFSAFSSSLAGGCGINTISDFREIIVLTPEERAAKKKRDPWFWEPIYTEIGNMRLSGGTGMTCGSFKDTPKCKGVYDAMCSKYTVLYQSPVRKNKRHPEKSHTGAFLCVWDTSSVPKKKRAPRALKQAPRTLVETEFDQIFNIKENPCVAVVVNGI